MSGREGLSLVDASPPPAAREPFGNPTLDEAASIKLPGGSGTEVIDFAYIMAASHSGSTLLTRLLANHPRVATVGETSAVVARGAGDVGLCSCGSTVDACSFWQRVRLQMRLDGISGDAEAFDTNYRFRRAKFVDRTLRAEFHGPLLEAARDVVLACSAAWVSAEQRISQLNEAMIRAVVGLERAQVFVDSSKEPHRLKFLMRIPSLHVRVIQLVRDGRGVAASYVRKNNWPVSEAVDEWWRSLRSQEHMIRRFRPGAVLRLRYEDLCRNPNEELRRVMHFVGVDPDEWTPNSDRSVHILGNRMRMQPIGDIKLDEKWKRELSAEQLREFERLGGRVNRRYGYV